MKRLSLILLTMFLINPLKADSLLIDTAKTVSAVTLAAGSIALSSYIVGSYIAGTVSSSLEILYASIFGIKNFEIDKLANHAIPEHDKADQIAVINATSKTTQWLNLLTSTAPYSIPAIGLGIGYLALKK